ERTICWRGALTICSFILLNHGIAGVKMKKWIGIITGIIVLAGLTVVVLFNFTNIFQASEEESLDEYVSNYEAGSYEEIYESLGEETKEHYDQEDVTERYHK